MRAKGKNLAPKFAVKHQLKILHSKDRTRKYAMQGIRPVEVLGAGDCELVRADDFRIPAYFDFAAGPKTIEAGSHLRRKCARVPASQAPAFPTGGHGNPKLLRRRNHVAFMDDHPR